ncbi:MAG: Zn-dependent oligopeptidase [Phycisphaeraceae bacterium]|nr:Zn-dependent oligopeptidase [Phycisphaeraceae bacterium]
MSKQQFSARRGLIAITAAVAIVTILGCSTTGGAYSKSSSNKAPARAAASEGHLRTIDDLQQYASRHRVILSLPRFERTPAQVAASAQNAMREADAALDRFGSQDPDRVTFRSTIAALDDIYYPVNTVANRMSLMSQTQPDPAMRDACIGQIKALSDWYVAAGYRTDVYNACKAYDVAYREGRKPRLFGEDLKLYEDTMRDFRRAGLELDQATRNKVEALQKDLARLSTDFDTNITNADVTLGFTAQELDGVPESFLSQAAMDNGQYQLKPTVITHFLAVMQNARSEAARKKMKTARYSVAQDVNTPLLQEIVRVRSEIAPLLGYDSWADYRTEIKMAKSAKEALAFEWDLINGLEPKFQDEISAYRALKVKDTGDPNAQIRIWDWRYYDNQLKKSRYSVDSEALRVYFPLEKCLAGMFDIYQEIFGLKFEQIDPGYTWFDGVTCWYVSDAATGDPLGFFYLDLYPRQGKYNHFAEFGIIEEKVMPNGRSQRPVVSLVCNFTPPTADAPSLMTHDELETLFHEFGHAMHAILTQTKYGQFAGTSVPGDFVEAPSQMLEAWVWDPKVLDRFAADYRDPSKKIDRKILDRMKEAKLATVATFYRRQLCFGVADLNLHMSGSYQDVAEVVNDAMAEVFLAPPKGTNFAAYWGHLTGYDAGYYGYAWADSIAADMASVFEHSPGGLMDRNIGMRLREEIYAVGGSRDINVSIRAFLQRDRSIEPFLRSIGIEE